MTAVELTQHEPGDEVLIEVKHLKMYFPVTSGVLVQRTVGYIKAVDDVSFVVRRGETLGLVGESGCARPRRGGAYCSCTGPPPAPSCSMARTCAA